MKRFRIVGEVVVDGQKVIDSETVYEQDIRFIPYFAGNVMRRLSRHGVSNMKIEIMEVVDEPVAD